MRTRLNVLRAVLPVSAAVASSVLFFGLAPAAPASTAVCSFPAQSSPFVPWSDSNSYFLAPGGNFDDGTAGWALAGSAGLVSGNEPYDVSDQGTSSLGLPTTSAAATSPVMCVTADAPTFRLFIKNNGNLGHIDGQLAVYLNFQNTNGKWQQVKIAALTVKSTAWTLSPKISFIQYISTPLQSGLANVSFTFKPNDNHGNWQLDDMFVDPRIAKLG
jgi:hypothetical protein